MRKISTFFYALYRGICNIFRNKWYSLASIATISACLFMFGIFYSVVENFRSIVKNVEEGVAITVFFDVGIEQSRVDAIGDLIKAQEGVSQKEDGVIFITAEEAWAQYQKEYFGDRVDEFIAGYPTNPLINDFNYQIKLSDVSKQADLVTLLQSTPGVRDVRYSTLTANTLSSMNMLIAYVSIAIIVILLGVSVFLIGNTIAMGISVRKQEIIIMKYVGATDFFVRAPFVFEGILIGLIGASIPLLGIYYAYNTILEYMVSRFPELVKLFAFVPIETICNTLVPICLLVGVGIGFVGSITTVRKNLHV